MASSTTAWCSRGHAPKNFLNGRYHYFGENFSGDRGIEEPYWGPSTKTSHQ